MINEQKVSKRDFNHTCIHINLQIKFLKAINIAVVYLSEDTGLRFKLHAFIMNEQNLNKNRVW